MAGITAQGERLSEIFFVSNFSKVKGDKRMSFLNLVNKRYSVRNYKNTPVARDTLNRCIEAARLAPSACNSQPWKFIVVDDAELLKKLSKAAFEGILKFNHFVFDAPALVVIVSERQKAFAKRRTGQTEKL